MIEMIFSNPYSTTIFWLVRFLVQWLIPACGYALIVTFIPKVVDDCFTQAGLSQPEA